MQLEEFRRKKAAAAAAKQKAASGGTSAAAQAPSAAQTPDASPVKPTAPPILEHAQPTASPVRRPAPPPTAPLSPPAAVSPAALQPARPPPSSLQQKPPAHGSESAAGTQAAAGTGRTNGAARQTAHQAAAATQTLAVNPLFRDDHPAEDGWGQQQSGAAAANPELVELQRAYGNQVSCDDHRCKACYSTLLKMHRAVDTAPPRIQPGYHQLCRWQRTRTFRSRLRS